MSKAFDKAYEEVQELFEREAKARFKPLDPQCIAASMTLTAISSFLTEYTNEHADRLSQEASSEILLMMLETGPAFVEKLGV